MMKKLLVLSVLTLLMTFLANGGAHAGEILDAILKRGELVIGTSGDQLPFCATTKEGEIVGLDADIAKGIAQSMKIKYRFARMPFADLLPALQAGKIDMIISGLTMNTERNLKVAFVGPYYVSGKGILIKEKTVETLKKEGLNSDQFRVAVLKDSTSKEVVEKAAPKAGLTLVASYEEALNLLYQDKVNCVVADLPFCTYIVDRYPEKKLAVADTKLSYEPKAIAIREDALWVNALDNLLKMSVASGEMTTLLEKWFKSHTWTTLMP